MSPMARSKETHVNKHQETREYFLLKAQLTAIRQALGCKLHKVEWRRLKSLEERVLRELAAINPRASSYLT